MIIWIVNDAIKKQLQANIQQHKHLYFFNGLIFMALGIIAIMSPLIAAEFLDILIGCVLFITGVFQASVSYASGRHWTYYLTAIIYVVAGALLVIQPQAGILALATIIAIFLLLQGCVQIFYASVYAPFKGWGWMLVGGLISIALTALIYTGWPVTAIWFLGIVVGINLFAFGLSLLMLTIHL